MTRSDVGQDASASTVSLTDQQAVVLQAIYERFRVHGRWPTLIQIDRPIRREHRWDTGAIILSIPESLIVPPRQGLRPVADDELRLRLLGIQACDGSSDDIERFVRTLRWLAEREEAYEPPPGSGGELPQVTSRAIAEYLGLDRTDPLPLQRLHAMLKLDHWGLGGFTNGGTGWRVRLGEDIWRFRDVHSVEDVVAAREAWLAEGRPAVPKADDTAQDGYFHVRLSVKGRTSKYCVLPDLSLKTLEAQVLAPYRSGHAIMTDGEIIQLTDITQIRIVHTDRSTKDLPMRRIQHAQGMAFFPSNDRWDLATHNGNEVTNDFIAGAPGQPAVDVNDQVPLPASPQAGPSYVDEKVIKAISAKDGQSKLDVTKLLALVNELNSNYASRHAYASHALLRAVLDHVPPILGCRDFTVVANNFAWGKSDTKYIKRLEDFRAQADDALHRQIRASADLLSLDDMPARAYVNRLLQECAERL
jgi:hypothetical protein